MTTSTNRIVHTSDSVVARAQRTGRKGIAKVAAVSDVMRYAYCPHVGDVIDVTVRVCPACEAGDR